MRSEAIDQLLSTYLKQPAKVSWKGALGDSVRGVFEGTRLELAGVSVMALPFDRLVIESDRFQITPGLPATISVVRPRLEISIDQRQLDRWLRQVRAPFSLVLRADGDEFRMDLRQLQISRVLTTIEVVRGWVILKPTRAKILGLENRLAALFRTYLPIPRLAPQTRITAIRVELTLDDIEDEITPGLVDRLRSQFLPFARSAPVSPP